MARLSDRLMAIYQLIDQDAIVIDVGTDHAAIPIALIESGKTAFVIASDVGKGPLIQAEEQIGLADLDDASRIDLRLGNGLSVANKADKIDTIVIAGMGGELIAKLLSQIPDFLNAAKLILQANNEQADVRRMIAQSNRLITDEQILLENGHFYEIIVATQTDKMIPLTTAELKFGPKLLQIKSELFRRKWQQELQRLNKIKKTLEQSSQRSTIRYDSVQTEIKEIEEVLK
ncbi:tRNA (adenine(22)-N(1))-methyltransferase [Oenococcus sicerae]|uniref:tRNA (adenine(22)-N(1))-methyltransferase n=1 Tax=Oenococcus sicerae TaxID=2203724 RepID=UPI0010B6FACE|nr:tRNA (adenine(22)-N(1))-methyltransferase [Oenococcus sicerae]